MTPDEKKELASEVLAIFSKALNAPNNIKRTGGVDHSGVLVNRPREQVLGWTFSLKSASDAELLGHILVYLDKLNDLLFNNQHQGLGGFTEIQTNLIVQVLDRLTEQSAKAKVLFMGAERLRQAADQSQAYSLTNKEATAHRIHRTVAELNTYIAEAKESGLKIQLGVNQKDEQGQVKPLQAVITELKTYPKP